VWTSYPPFGKCPRNRIKRTINNAIAQWNAKTSTTNVRFTTDGAPDINFINAGQNNTCSSYASGNDGIQQIRISSFLIDAMTVTAENTQAVVTARIAKAMWPIAHELGHTFDLGESSDASSIMKVPSYVQCNGNSIDTFSDSKSVTQADADAAKACVAAIVPRDEIFGDDGSDYYHDTVPDCECSCWTEYEVVVGYRYADAPGGYVTVELYRYEIDHGCGPPPT
jgi:hypothetical protein